MVVEGRSSGPQSCTIGRLTVLVCPGLLSVPVPLVVTSSCSSPTRLSLRLDLPSVPSRRRRLASMMWVGVNFLPEDFASHADCSAASQAWLLGLLLRIVG